MKFGKHKSVKVTAEGENCRYISSTNDSLDSKAAILYWAKYTAEREHKTLKSVKVVSDSEYARYTPSGKVIDKGLMF